MKAIINSQITDFSLPAYYNEGFVTIGSEDLKGHWSILFFYPNDFCFVCPTELADMADIYNDLSQIGVEVYGISPDSHYAHKAWHDASPSVNKIQFPMLSDRTGKVGKSLGVISPESGIIRSTFLMNPEGRIELAEYHESGVGRDSGELLRKVSLIVEAYR
ncbi:redoxin domain-containing protein [Bacteroides sp. 51]|uniref:redoxin domain-containing protein n=1 Tax=Bacteroides sp. 51 TaxID=2302938 RepID=UPI0013D2865A|nr:redoxin domain-containing protein [Bacteroides sp. 51]NDV81255.1 peroxiredoxin [Bacteroides sp. 51]